MTEVILIVDFSLYVVAEQCYGKRPGIQKPLKQSSNALRKEVGSLTCNLGGALCYFCTRMRVENFK